MFPTFGMTTGHLTKASHFVPILFFTVIAIFLTISILVVNDGNLIFSLDDAYIHLSLASQIAQGHYGINASEPSAPASSIIWPFLLTPVTLLPIAEYIILVINILCMLGSLYLFSRILSAVLSSDKQTANPLFVGIGTVVLGLACNLLGLVFMGMEHSLQLLATIWLVYEMIEYGRTSQVRWFLLIVLIAGPLIRYENLALSIPAICILAINRQFRAAIGALVPLLIIVGGFSLYLNWQGLGWMPASIMIKSATVAEGGKVASLLRNLADNLNLVQGRILAIGLVMLVFSLALPGRSRGDRTVTVWALSAGLLHMLVGRFGWYNRYEIYAWATVLLILIYVYRTTIYNLCNQAKGYILLALTLLALGVTALPYLGHLSTIRVATNNIYHQQYQMRRFAIDFYNAPVAVNDLGLVSLGNDHHVLDLWGLASEKARENRRSSDNTDWIDELTACYDVKLAMIYDEWFPQRPDHWQALGQLHLGRRKITPANSSVTFYALDSTTYARVLPLLEEFAATLPDRAEFTFEQQ